jgi:regulator of sigma E protease
MDIFGQLYGFLASAAGYLVPFLFVLSIVVFFHELGHFVVARWCGVRVEAFSIGFGREIVGWNDRRGTRWKLCWVPLGGYVKFLGDESAASQPVTEEKLASLPASQRSEAFPAKPVWQRAAVVAAGPAANFLLAIAIFTVLFATAGRPIVEPRVDAVISGSAAEAAGIRPGDVLVMVDGRAVETFNDVQRMVATSNGRTIEITVRRDGRELTLEATPRAQEAGRGNRTFMLGLSASRQGSEMRVYDPVSALGLAVRETWFLVDRTVVFIRDLFTGRGSMNDLGGPIRIAEVSGQAAAISFTTLIGLTALLSVSIGLLNLFPIPMLDGGHLVFYAIEALRGRPLSERSQEIGFRIGLAFVLMLMVVTTWNDISRLLPPWPFGS